MRKGWANWGVVFWKLPMNLLVDESMVQDQGRRWTI